MQQKNVIKIYDDNLADCTNKGMGYNVPPLINHVAIYFLQQNMALPDVQLFYKHHENLKWKTVTGRPEKNWKVLAKDWIYNTIQNRKLLERQEAKRKAFPDT
ncbi:hypothetical protein [Mucilaginibacter sp. 10I4]|uniref:hypothetical protein n=1 Tax=Mucilaginibacter sp. 10I4 TaxID=3048580 RepID=UPI002B23B5A2|nr:hypothetical protein [Mucilaginibacter sp. 10I4]MEB0261828.1 hypothetical protein [Mucilaginibacter sp. 10I4]